ncbi:MAG: hypothetical protein IT258_09025 [Saprospiraceae bacterium]|nr:hypothetical protein [Saprospiraceae bacterium]
MQQRSVGKPKRLPYLTYAVAKGRYANKGIKRAVAFSRDLKGIEPAGGL